MSHWSNNLQETARYGNANRSKCIERPVAELLEAIAPETNRGDLIVDEQTHRRALNALRAQQDHDAIAEGIAQMEAGEGKPVEQAFEELRSRWASRPRHEGTQRNHSAAR